MPFFQAVGDRHRLRAITPCGEGSGFEKVISRSSQRRHDDKWLSGKLLSNDICGSIHSGGVLDRGAAELHDNHSGRITN